MSSISSRRLLSQTKGYVKFWQAELDTNQSFYLMILGFLLFQLVTDFISICAATYNIGLEILLRCFFFLLQSGMLFLAENGVSKLQLRVLLTIWANSGIKACSIDASPFETLFVLIIIGKPVFDFYDYNMRNPNKNDPHVIEEEEQETTVDSTSADELPIHMPRGDIKISTKHYIYSWQTTLASVLFMTYLLSRRVQLTPDFFHFVTCLPVNLQNSLWLWLLWIAWRQPNCAQDVVMAGIELMIANLLMGSAEGLIFQVLLLPASYMFTTNKIFTTLRCCFYFGSNFWVNFIDWCYKMLIKEGAMNGFKGATYYHDEFISDSFSYKVHQMALVNLFAFCTAELIYPNHVKSVPELLSFFARFSIPVACSMFFSFLLELTWFSPEQRLAVFQGELLKLLMTVIVLNIGLFIVTSWAWQLSKQIIEDQRDKEKQIAHQRRMYTEYISRLKRYRPNIRDGELPSFVLKVPMTENQELVNNFESIGIAEQSLNDYMSYMAALFGVYTETQCGHLVEKVYRRQISAIQNQSALIIFILLQIPLSKLSSLFSFVTCIFVWAIDSQTKRFLYDLTYSFVYLDAGKLKSLFVSEKSKDYQDIPKQEVVTKEEQRGIKTAVDWTCLHIFIMGSLWLNYFYQVFFNAMIASTALNMIGIFDKIGFEIHFVRFAYWALVDSVEGHNLLQELGNDKFLLIILIAMQILCLRFLTAPTHMPTDARVQAFAAPVGLIICFYFQAYDVLWMDIHCMLVLLYCGYYCMDSENMGDYS